MNIMRQENKKPANNGLDNKRSGNNETMEEFQDLECLKRDRRSCWLLQKGEGLSLNRSRKGEMVDLR